PLEQLTFFREAAKVDLLRFVKIRQLRQGKGGTFAAASWVGDSRSSTFAGHRAFPGVEITGSVFMKGPKPRESRRYRGLSTEAVDNSVHSLLSSASPF